MTAAAKREMVVPDHLRELAEELPLTLGLKEAAEALSMHPRSVQRMIAAGELQAMRSRLSGSARLIIPRSEIIRWCIDHSAR